jgi:probable phosphoglycerate mutase
VVLWRHGQTTWNVENRFQGHTDVELDHVGREQARQAARLLTGLRPDAIISSDLVRARATAEALAALVGLPVEVDEGLRETHGGAWEGLTSAEIMAKDAEAYNAWRRGEDIAPGGTGESRSLLAERAGAVFDRAVADLAEGSTLVVVTHGGTVRALLGRLLALPVEYWTVLGGLSNCCWSVLGEVADGGRSAGGATWRLLEHNAGSLPEPVMGDER